MLRNRSRPVGSKQGLMADPSPLCSPSDKYSRRPSSSFFNSPRLFTGFAAKGPSDSEAAMSPTSILDTKPFSAINGNPFWSDKVLKSADSHLENKNPYSKIEGGGVGLGILEALDEPSDGKRDSRMVLFGSQLRIQIPPTGSLESPRDFGIKTLKSMNAFSPRLSTPCSGQRIPNGSSNFGPEMPNSPQVFTGNLTVSEMELSEDYTCVISHGPNPKTTHIFDNCIVETCLGCSISGKEEKLYPSATFLSFCYTCKKDLGQGKDIYIYRGEKAFCSQECRYQEMLSEKSSLDSSAAQFNDLFDPVGTCS